MAVTGGAVVWSPAAGLHLKRSDIGGKAVTGSRRADSVRLKGATPLVTSPLCPDTKKENVRRRSLFYAGRPRTMAFHECCPWRCGHAFPFYSGSESVISCREATTGTSHPDQRKVFSGWGESARGGRDSFYKKRPSPLSFKKALRATIRRRRRSRCRRRDWRRFRQGGPDGRLPACADGYPGGGCIRSRRCAPDGGRR